MVATTVALTFTDQALAVVMGMLPLLVALAAITTTLALAISVLQARLTGVPLSRMVLVTFPLARVEAAIIAENRGLPVAPVILGAVPAHRRHCCAGSDAALRHRRLFVAGQSREDV